MNKSEKLDFLDSIKNDLLSLPLLDNHYQVITDRLTNFLARSFPPDISSKWISKISQINWISRVFAIGGDNSPEIHAWTKGRENTLLVIESIQNEVLDDDLYQSNYSSAILNIFSSSLDELSVTLFEVCPELSQVVQSIDSNLKSQNPEDWANAANSSRRILMKLADVLFPPRDTPRVKGKNTYHLTQDKYLNRLVAYIEDQHLGESNETLLLSILSRVCDELDALNSVDSKGTHSNVTLFEAKTYVMYTFMLAGSIATLSKLSK